MFHFHMILQVVQSTCLKLTYIARLVLIYKHKCLSSNFICRITRIYSTIINNHFYVSSDNWVLPLYSTTITNVIRICMKILDTYTVSIPTSHSPQTSLWGCSCLTCYNYEAKLSSGRTLFLIFCLKKSWFQFYYR